MQLPAAEQQYGHDTTGYAGIGKVEDGRKEDEMLASHEWQPRGPVPRHEGEVEHIHYPAIEPVGIARTKGHELGYIRGHGVVEYLSVEKAIDDVARGSGQYQRHTDEEDIIHSLPDELTYYIYKEADGHNAERGEKQFVHQFHPKGHTVILGKQNLEPRGHFYRLVHIHMGLHPYLDYLVHEDGRQRDADGRRGLICFSGHIRLLGVHEMFFLSTNHTNYTNGRRSFARLGLFELVALCARSAIIRVIRVIRGRLKNNSWFSTIVA